MMVVLLVFLKVHWRLLPKACEPRRWYRPCTCPLSGGMWPPHESVWYCPRRCLTLHLSLWHSWMSPQWLPCTTDIRHTGFRLQGAHSWLPLQISWPQWSFLYLSYRKINRHALFCQLLSDFSVLLQCVPVPLRPRTPVDGTYGIGPDKTRLFTFLISNIAA